jgi:hypothetical protein
VATLKMNPGTNEKVALMIAAKIAALGNVVQENAQDAAPQVKVWQTMQDELVRPWHRTAHNQSIPGNLLFELDQAPYKGVQHPRGHDYLRFPRDPRAGHLQIDYCRCFLTWNDDLARSINTVTTVMGTKVTSIISTDYPRARESEYGAADAEPAAFMHQGLVHAKAMLG